jgi:Carboxypeptidase regulatory-like domain
MDTPSSPPLESGPSPTPRLPRWLRVGVLLGMILLVQGTLAYVLSWIDPPQTPCFVAIGITEYQSNNLSSGRRSDGDLPFVNTRKAGTNRNDVQQALNDLAGHGPSEPVVVYLSAIALQADGGDVFILPSDASPDDPSTWLRLREVLEKLRACTSRQKLLVVDLTPPPPSPWLGYVYHDLASAIPRELDAVPDADRLVLCTSSPGQTPYVSRELGQSVFAHYFREALCGDADGYGDLRDGHVTVKELAAFVQARVERWSNRNRGEPQTPVLLGTGGDFALVSVDHGAPRAARPARSAREYSGLLVRHWQDRDNAYQSGAFRLTPADFQRRQAIQFQWEQQHDADHLTARMIPPHKFEAKESPPEIVPELPKKTFDEQSHVLDQQLAGAKPADAERMKKRFVEETRGKLSAADLDAAVFTHALADPRLDPAAIRLYDQLLHTTPQTLPRTAEALRIRQLADLAMRVEVLAWPRDVVETLLRTTDAGEKSLRQTPYLPGYVDLLEEPARARHDGEVRLWTRGYSSLDDAKQRLTEAAQKFERLARLNEKWRDCETALDEAFAELPWFLEAMGALPELRTPWDQAAAAAHALADTLKSSPDDKLPWLIRVERLAGQIETAEKYVKSLRQHRQALHAPFAKDALAGLDQQCRSSRADPATLRNAEAILSVAAPILRAEDRATLWQAAQILAQRLNAETLALDRQDNELPRVTATAEVKTPPLQEESRRAALRARWQFTLMELAGASEDRLRPLRQSIEQCQQDASNPAGWCDLGAKFRHVMNQEMPKQYDQETDWRQRERLAWLMPPLNFLSDVDRAKVSPTIEHRRGARERLARWRQQHCRYLACDYHGLNLESPGVVAARAFYAPKVAGKSELEAQVRMNLAAPVEPLTEKQPYSHVWLEVTRQVPPGAYEPVELRFHCPDDVWLEVAPDSAYLPALVESKEPRTLTHKVPLKATRKPKAERTGLPPPIGFLVEARFEGRSYHHLVTVPIVPSTQLVQILVSADSAEPATTLNEIRVRPGKVKQPHHVYVRNLTNRTQKVHVEVKAGETPLHKSQKLIILEPDGVRKVIFEDSAPVAELRGALTVRVLDADRHKVLQETLLRVEILSPHEYVKVAEASYEPGRGGNNKWAVQVQTSRSVVGPAIAAQLVLPVQRIPGLMGIGGGTLHVELPTQPKSPRILFAEKLRLVHTVEEEGPVYLHIDGVPRAFIYRTTFARAGEPNQPRADDRPAVRLVAPPCVMAGINCLVDVEVDNAPPGCKLEIALGRTLEDRSFKAEIVREFTHAKKQRIDLEASKDALVFAATIDDWTATFDTRAIVGARALRARLIDAGGTQIAQSRQALVIDDSPPIAHIAPTPAQVKKGTVLQVQAQGADPESGVAQVVFFYGKPDKGEIPTTAPRFKAVPANRELTQWSAALQVPADHKGPLAVSVQVVNHAGMASIDTVMLEVTDREPGKTGLGEIRGKVIEGPRPQPNLTVILTDERGKEIARTRTQADGSYVFQQLAPGRYRVVCVKPESQRRAIMGVIVEPDRGARADLALSL